MIDYFPLLAYSSTLFLLLLPWPAIIVDHTTCIQLNLHASLFLPIPLSSSPSLSHHPTLYFSIPSVLASSHFFSTPRQLSLTLFLSHLLPDILTFNSSQTGSKQPLRNDFTSLFSSLFSLLSLTFSILFFFACLLLLLSFYTLLLLPLVGNPRCRFITPHLRFISLPPVLHPTTATNSPPTSLALYTFPFLPFTRSLHLHPHSLAYTSPSSYILVYQPTYSLNELTVHPPHESIHLLSIHIHIHTHPINLLFKFT